MATPGDKEKRRSGEGNFVTIDNRFSRGGDIQSMWRFCRRFGPVVTLPDYFLAIFGGGRIAGLGLFF